MKYPTNPNSIASKNQTAYPTGSLVRSKKTTRTSPTTNANGNRHKVLHNYHDHAGATVPRDVVNAVAGGGGGYGEKRKGPRGGVTVPFPTKLHVMLSKAEEEGSSDVVSWQPHGRCFVVHKPKEFVMEVMPIYFRQSKLTSFQRQLNLYGFSRITTGKDRGGYYHELFLKHKLFLCQNMCRIRIKGTGIKGKASPETEPDFYSMPWVKNEGASVSLNRDLEGEISAAMEEENVRSDPNKRRDSGGKRKPDAPRKDKYAFVANGVNSSPRSAAVAFEYPPVLVTPDNTNVKKQLPVASPFPAAPDAAVGKFLRRLGRRPSRTAAAEIPLLLDLGATCPPMPMSSDSEDAYAEEEGEKLHAGDEIAFEGQRFRYLDSLTQQHQAAQQQQQLPPAPQSSSFVLEPRRDGAISAEQQRRGLRASVPSSSFRPMAPRAGSGLSESSFSIALSLREPILTPSSSSSSLGDAFRQEDEMFEIDPNTIFTNDGGFCGDWEIGGEDVDIDAEFKLL